MIARLKRYGSFCFFAGYLLLGLAIYRDYGISWDESTSRVNGGTTVKYVGHKLWPTWHNEGIEQFPDLDSYADKDYGVAFEAPLVALELPLRLQSERSIYQFRHLATFLYSFLGVVAIFSTTKRIYRSGQLGVLAALILVLSPRFFAESFYNSKDIVFMASISIAIYTMVRLLQGPSVLRAIAHGWTTAFAIDVRAMAIIIAACTIGALLLQVAQRSAASRVAMASLAVYLVTVCVFVLAMFPYLWDDPLNNFVAAFEHMMRFRWEYHVRYLGEWFLSTQLPWHYAPVWMLITIPVMYTVFMLAGSVVAARQLVAVRNPLRWSTTNLVDAICLLLLFGPIAAVIAFKSVLYDGWRHLYFVFPAFVLLTVKGIVSVMRMLESPVRARARSMFMAMVVLGLATNAYWIYRAHPLQNVYFNFLAGSDWKNKFDLDYWGLGNTDAVRYVLDHDPSPAIAIRADSGPPLRIALIPLDSEVAQRVFVGTNPSLPQYVLTDYRWVKEPDDQKYARDYDLFYRKQIFGETILSVFRKK